MMTDPRAAPSPCSPRLLRTSLLLLVGVLTVLWGRHKRPLRQKFELCGSNGTLFVVPGAGPLSSNMIGLESWARVFRVVYVATNCSASFPKGVHCVPATRLTRHPHHVFRFAETVCPDRLVALTHADVALQRPERFRAIVQALLEHQARQEARAGAYRGWAVGSSRLNGTDPGLKWHSFWMWHSRQPLVPALLPVACTSDPPLFQRLLALAVDPAQRELIELDADLVLTQRQEAPPPGPWHHRCLNQKVLFRPRSGGTLSRTAAGAFGAASQPLYAIGAACGQAPCLRPHPLYRNMAGLARSDSEQTPAPDSDLNPDPIPDFSLNQEVVLGTRMDETRGSGGLVNGQVLRLVGRGTGSIDTPLSGDGGTCAAKAKTSVRKRKHQRRRRPTAGGRGIGCAANRTRCPAPFRTPSQTTPTRAFWVWPGAFRPPFTEGPLGQSSLLASFCALFTLFCACCWARGQLPLFCVFQTALRTTTASPLRFACRISIRLIETAVGKRRARSGFRFSSPSLRVMSAATLSCGTTVALDCSYSTTLLSTVW